jgi:predicted DsbA family dithiol-disulfide isomerase
VPKLTAVYVDFTDVASYRVWRWLDVVGLQGVTDIRPYSLDSREGQEEDPWDRTTPAFGLELLALAEFARDAGPEPHRAFVEAAFTLVHDADRDASSPESMLLLGAAAGLDLDRWTADSERWRAEVGLYHREGEDELGVRGVPSLVFDDEHALLVALQEDITDEDAARRLLADLTDLAVQPVTEVRKTA